MMKRRSFLASMLAAATAPAFVRSESLMVPAPQRIVLPADTVFIPSFNSLGFNGGGHCDSDSNEAYVLTGLATGTPVWRRLSDVIEAPPERPDRHAVTLSGDGRHAYVWTPA